MKTSLNILFYCIFLIHLNAQTLQDIDDNIYTTVKIGSQVWMAENLRTTKYNNGTSIPLVCDSNIWTTLTNGGYCLYNNDEASYKNIYGILYNWYAVNTGYLCPKGWHIPTDTEWTILTDYLEGWEVAGGKLKETGTIHWQSPNEGATNETGFTALPSGFRSLHGRFNDIRVNGIWWTATEDNTDDAFTRIMIFNGQRVYKSKEYKNIGFAVRCVKN